MEKNPAIYILDKNKTSKEVLMSFLVDLGFNNINDSVSYESVLNEPNLTSSLVFLDISDGFELYEGLIEKINSKTDKIIVTSDNFSTDIIIKMIRCGAKDFLPKPILKDDLDRIIKTVLDTEKETKESVSKIITIFSNKGGIGKTTIATNLALELSKIVRDKVLLIDLNLQLGDVSTFLNLNPTFDVAYVAKNLVNKPDEIVLSSCERYKDSDLYILSDPNYIEKSESITPFDIENLFKKIRKIFSYVIVDMSSNINPNSLKILDVSDMILLTTIVNIPAIRNVQRCLNLFSSRYYKQEKVKVIINRFIDNDEISLTDIETTLDKKIYWKIPNNYFSIMESINKGVAVSEVGPSSNVANNFKDFASKIFDDIVEQEIIKYRK